MLLNKSKGGDNKEKQNGKGAHKRLFINLVVLFVVWLASAILFSAKVSAQGLILVNDEGEAVEQSVLKSTHLDVQVRGMLAFVELEQVYQNPSLTMLNGRYQFPLPENSAVFHMEMRLDNRLILGEIKLKQQAKAIYQEAQRQGHKAALVNNDSGNVFQTKVANIEPGQEVAVKLKFQFNLDYNNESFSLRIPTVVNSRYYNQTPENPLQQIELDQAEWVPAQNFLPVNVATSHSVKNKITTNIEVDLGFELDTVSSQTHQLSVVQTDTTRYQVIPANYNLFANRDIEIKFNPLMKEQVMRQIFVEKVGDEYF